MWQGLANRRALLLCGWTGAEYPKSDLLPLVL